MGFYRFLEYAKEGLLNFLFPLVCESCGSNIRESEGYSICANCMKKIEFINFPICQSCGKPLSVLVSFEKGALCADCQNKKMKFCTIRSVTYYKDVMRRCIHLLKYKKQVKLIKPLGNIMINYLSKNVSEDINKIDYIIPVPLQKEDFLIRGFNQSELLARYIAKYFSIKFTNELLIKKNKNKSQVGLTREERKKNVLNVYEVNYSYKLSSLSKIMLIDDIFTTGATIEACCKELKKTGVKNMYVLTLARGI